MEAERQWEELKRIRRAEKACARTLKGRALLVIEDIAASTGLEDAGVVLGKIYRIAHCALGLCLCEHEDWVRELEDYYKRMQEGGVVNENKVSVRS